CLDKTCTRTLRHVAYGLDHCAITVAENDDFVPMPQVQRAQHGVAACCRILDKSELVRCGTHEPRQRSCRCAQQRRDLARQEAGGLSLHAPAPCLLRCQHNSWRSAERAMVDSQERRVEVPFMPDRRPQRHTVIRGSVTHYHPLTAPAVSPATRYRCR